MFGTWYTAALLAIESQTVIALRLTALAGGGPTAQTEGERMVSEKIDAATEALDTLMAGGSADAVIAGYRERVRANAERLGRDQLISQKP
ncbi:hypothetical protein [Methylobacterium oryzisoli]|uniref:hypothetical protein n=1 Tax=Methylobacterium oryzisoli TaxID=3385502 RepID=UPI0038913CA3